MNTQNSNSERLTLLVSTLRERQELLATVESCTGGLVGSILTSVSGASDVYVGGAITYSNSMKTKCVRVSSNTLEKFGAVSLQTAMEMANGALDAFEADIAISITGIAGPNGGTKDKPVGTVWIGIAHKSLKPDTRRFVFPGDRDSVRQLSAQAAIQIATQCLTQHIAPISHEQERFTGNPYL